MNQHRKPCQSFPNHSEFQSFEKINQSDQQRFRLSDGFETPPFMPTWPLFSLLNYHTKCQTISCLSYPRPNSHPSSCASPFYLSRSTIFGPCISYGFNIGTMEHLREHLTGPFEATASLFTTNVLGTTYCANRGSEDFKNRKLAIYT